IGQIATGQVTDAEEDGKDAAAVSLGRRGGLKGGKARASKLSKEQRKAIVDLVAAQSNLLSDVLVAGASKGQEDNGGALPQPGRYGAGVAELLQEILLSFADGDLGGLARHGRRLGSGRSWASVARPPSSWNLNWDLGGLGGSPIIPAALP